jgi:hypothetical protein
VVAVFKALCCAVMVFVILGSLGVWLRRSRGRG